MMSSCHTFCTLSRDHYSRVLAVILKAADLQAVMIALTQHWGRVGFEQHCKAMQQFYQRRATIMHSAALQVGLQEVPGLSVYCAFVHLLLPYSRL